MKRLVVLSGAGISAESGLRTFRDANGLWENHDIMEVASIEGWRKNPGLVLEFYNQRRAQLASVHPNEAHIALKHLESHYEVQIITQNVDNLHERAGSSAVLHLHGELAKACSSADKKIVYEIGTRPIELGEVCELGSQLRPFIVWFGEEVPNMRQAIQLVEQAEILLIIGTSMLVYPAAGLVDYLPANCRLYVIDKSIPSKVSSRKKVTFIEKPATKGVPEVVTQLLDEAIA